MLHARYWAVILLALLAGVAVSVGLLVLSTDWICAMPGGCMDGPAECWYLYLGIAFGPALIAVMAWLRAWRQSRAASP